MHTEPMEKGLTMSIANAGLMVLNTDTEAQDALVELRRSGLDMKKLAIVGRDYCIGRPIVGCYNAGDRILFWGKRGADLGGLWGILFGSTLVLVPGAGPLVIGGRLVSALVAGFQGAAAGPGLSSFGAGLYNLGLPKDTPIESPLSRSAQPGLLECAEIWVPVRTTPLTQGKPSPLKKTRLLQTVSPPWGG